MFNNDVYTQYKENSVFTSSPEELTLMLYNGLIKFIMQAQKLLEENDISNAHTKIVKAQDIIRELRSTLNMKYELSNGIAQLYDYMYKRLVEANIKKDIEILDEILGFSKEFRDTWSQAMKIARIQGNNNYTQQIAK